MTDRASGIRSVTTRMPLASDGRARIARVRVEAVDERRPPQPRPVGHRAPPPRRDRRGAATAATTVAATVAAAAGRRGRAEVAELLADLGVERVLERHLLAVAARRRTGALGRRSLAATGPSRRRPPPSPPRSRRRRAA